MPWICIGLMTPVRPMTSKMLNTLDPNTFPMAIPLLPLRAATTLVANSGIDVPIATTVRPMTASLTPRAAATFVAPSTNTLLPSTRQASPTRISATIFHTGIACSRSFASSFSSLSSFFSPLFACCNVININTRNSPKRMPASRRVSSPS